MTTTAAARVLVALSLVCASLARADDPAGATPAPATPPTSGTRTAQDVQGRPAQPSKRPPPPAVLMLPLIGLVLLPLTLPVTQPRVRQPVEHGDARPAGTGAAEVATAATAPAPAPASDGRAPARATSPCPTCGDARQAPDPGARR